MKLGPVTKLDKKNTTSFDDDVVQPIMTSICQLMVDLE